MKRIALALIAASLVACGKKDDRAVVRLLIGPDTNNAWKEIVERFEKAHPKIRIELMKGPWAPNEREGRYITSFQSSKAAFDVVFMDVIWVAKFAAQGWLRPLDDKFPKEKWGEFMPGDIEGSVYGGKIYRIPMQSDAGLLYYRTDLVEKAPETFDELVELSRKHQKPPGLWGYVSPGQQSEGLVCAFLEVLWGHGGDVLDADGQVLLDRPEAVKALEWMKGSLGAILPEAATTYQEEECRKIFQNGKAVFMRNWPYAWTLMQENGSAVAGKIGVVPMVHAPGQRGAGTLGGWGFGIAKNSPNADAAWAFVDFATQPEQMKLFHFKSGAIPPRKALFQDSEILEKSPHYPKLYEALLASRPRPVHPKYAQMSDAIRGAVSATLAGDAKPAEALRQAAERIRSLLKS